VVNFTPNGVGKIAIVVEESKNTPHRLIEDKVIKILMIKEWKLNNLHILHPSFSSLRLKRLLPCRQSE